MLLSPYAKLAFRYIDSRSTPYVHGITPNLNGDIKHIGKSLKDPFLLTRFNKIYDPSTSDQRIDQQRKINRSKQTSRKWNQFPQEMNNIVRQEKEREEDAQFLSEGMGISLCVILNACTSLDTNKNQLIDMHLSRLATNLDPFSNTLSFKKTFLRKY
jgi:hypothetical protein